MYAKSLKCISCEAEYPLSPIYECEVCGGILNIVYDYRGLNPLEIINNENSSYRFLPLMQESMISLGEGKTPLVKAQKLANRIGVDQLLLKCEFCNPTGSFKDRPVSVGISKAKEFSYRKVAVASSGNGAASVAAYSARAGLEALIMVPENTSPEKVRQAAFYGGRVIKVEGPYSNCFRLVKEISNQSGTIFNLTTTFINPYTLEGDKLVAYELIYQMGRNVPDAIFVPVGAGPLLVGIFKGFTELYHFGVIDRLPKMVGVQAEGCSPIAKAYLANQKEVISEDNPNSVAGGICDGLTGYSQDGTYTLTTIKQSNGFAIYCDDKSILEAQKWIAQDEGIFVEPSSAAAIAGIWKSLRQDRIDKSETIVALLTGHGLKDMGNVRIGAELPTIPNNMDSLLHLIR